MRMQLFWQIEEEIVRKCDLDISKSSLRHRCAHGGRRSHKVAYILMLIKELALRMLFNDKLKVAYFGFFFF